MATHSSVLAWRIPGTGDLVGCRLGGRTESDTTAATQLQQQQQQKRTPNGTLYKKPTWGRGALPFSQGFVRRSQQVDITMNAATALETLICTSELVFHQPAHQVGVLCSFLLPLVTVLSWKLLLNKAIIKR